MEIRNTKQENKETERNSNLTLNKLSLEDTLQEEVMFLLDCGKARQLHWLGSRSDLVVLAHYVWVKQWLTDDLANPMRLYQVVTLFFNLMQVPEVRNARAVMSQANRRKGIYVLPFMERLQHIYEHDPHPLRRYYR